MVHFAAKEQKSIKTHLIIARVVDGDGLILADFFEKKETEIRLLGIDAPELKYCNKLIHDERETHIAGQFLVELGKLSFKFLLSIAPPGTHVTLAQEQSNLVDVYGRTLAYVFLPDGRCLNDILISEGFAKPYSRHFCNQLPKYQELSSRARMDKKGLFALVNRF